MVRDFPGVIAAAGTRRAAAVAVVAISVYYGVLGLAVLRPEAVYAGDIGVKYVQAQALAANRFRSLDIRYSGDFIDPERRFSPLRPPFVMEVANTTQAIFPPASAVFQAIAVAAAGFRGMILLTVVSAAVILYAVRRLAPNADATSAVVAAGLASPLWFYAISGWEHAPAVAFGALAFALVLTDREPWPLVAGLSLGVGATIRDEVILLAPGLLLAVWVTRRGFRPILLVAIGTIVPLLAAMAMDVWWFERPAAAHLRHAVHMLQTALSITGEANPEVPVLHPMTHREKYEVVIQYWLLGYGNDRWIAIFSLGAAAALGLRLVTGWSVWLLAWVAGIIVLALIDWHELMTAPKWLAGLLRVAPYVVFVLFPRPRATPGNTTLQRVMLATAGAYLLLAFIGADTHGGKSLGPRLLLPLLPLLTVPAVMQVRAYVTAPGRVERLIGYGGLLLIGLSLMMHLFGTTRAYIGRNREDAQAVVALAESRPRIVVADDMYTAQLLMTLHRRKVILLADTKELAAELGTLLSNNRVTEVVLVTRHPDRDIALDPMRLQHSEVHGRMMLNYYRR